MTFVIIAIEFGHQIKTDLDDVIINMAMAKSLPHLPIEYGEADQREFFLRFVMITIR